MPKRLFLRIAKQYRRNLIFEPKYGQKAFLARRAAIDKIVGYINAAIMIETKGIYYYFMAYIKYDYFERKYLNTSPGYTECLHEAVSAGLSETDIQFLFETMGVERPPLFSKIHLM